MNLEPRSDAAHVSGSGRRMVVPNSFVELRRVSEWVRSFAQECQLAQQLAYGLELSVNEALTNIISYAYRDREPHNIVVELCALPDRIRVEVEDDGVPFNPLELALEEPADSLWRSRPAGRGIPLMRGFMDELRYLRRDSRNVLTMDLRTPQT